MNMDCTRVHCLSWSSIFAVNLPICMLSFPLHYPRRNTICVPIHLICLISPISSQHGSLCLLSMSRRVKITPKHTLHHRKKKGFPEISYIRWCHCQAVVKTIFINLPFRQKIIKQNKKNLFYSWNKLTGEQPAH